MDTAQDPQNTGEILQPDKRLAAIALALLVLMFAAAWFAKDYLPPRIAAWLQHANAAAPGGADARTVAVLLAFASIPALLCVLYAFWTGLMAYRIFKTDAFPPKGYPILLKTRVRRGGAARREAMTFILTGIGAILVLAYLCWSLFSTFPVGAALRALLR